MNIQDPALAATPAQLLSKLTAIRAIVIEGAIPLLSRWDANGADPDPALVNLAHYIALRQTDLRSLQRELMQLGLSSLGRLESRVIPTLDAVINALAALSGDESAVVPAIPIPEFFAGETRLQTAADALFGPPPAHRRSRIMVTIPGEAATTPALLPDLARCGMDVARVNCAHDNAETWRMIADETARAAEQVGHSISILMDIAGPKIRTGEVAYAGRKKIDVGGLFRLVASGAPRLSKDVGFAAAVSVPEIVTRLEKGDRVRYDDGKLEGIVESTAPDEAVVRVTAAKAGGAKLKSEKGLNLPDTDLGLSPLTAKDEADLVTVLECADIIGYSFVRRPDDIDLLETVIDRMGASGRRPGLIAKIERPEAVRNLPELIARASKKQWRFGVMIARGDLAAEIGFERLAEMQEEILWLCEAASVPVIWATQVLEDLVKDGIPSRGEMTDAAMAVRADCVMLNKGPAIHEGVMLLDRLLTRMEGHILKKTPTLRALKAWS